MQNIKKILPFIAAYFALTQLYYIGLGIFKGHSVFGFIYRRLRNGDFEYLIKSMNIVLDPLMTVLLLIGMYNYYIVKQGRLNQLLIIGLAYFSFSLLFSLPYNILILNGVMPSYMQEVSLLRIIHMLFSFACMGIVLHYFINRKKRFQKERFPPRERPYGLTPYEKYLEENKETLGWKRFYNYLFQKWTPFLKNKKIG